MRVFFLNILITLVFLCFATTDSYAFSKSGCTAFDLICKMTGKGSSDGKASKKSEISLEEEIKILSEETKRISANTNTEINAYTGMFDFSDDKQAAGLFGIQHQNDELWKNSFLGKLSPITGGFLTVNSAFYIYSGVQWEYDLGLVTITPSFAPGYYNYGNGKDLGYPLEFKSEVQMSLNFSETTQLGMSYNHISNASLGTKNPGANSYMLNFLKQF